MIKQTRFNFLTTLLGGGLVGLLIAVFPYFPFWQFGEFGHLRAYLLEMVYKVLGLVLPIPAMRAIHSPAGVILAFILMGMAMALAAALFAKKGRSPFRVLILSLAGAISLFSLAFLVAWGKTLFFFPFKTFFSFSGALWLAGSAVLSALLGLLIFFLLKLNRTVSLIVLGLAVLAAVSPLVLQKGPAPTATTEPPSQVLLIGLDAANWDVMMPLLRQGRLPNIRRLMEEGTWGDLRSTLKSESPVIWTSIATGVRQAKHGINGFAVRRKDTGEMVPISVSFRKVEALWDIAGRHQKKTDVVAWYGSWPAEEVRGCFVSTRVGFKGLGMRVYPAERLEEIEALGPLAELPYAPQISRIGLHLLQKDAPDLALIYFPDLDGWQHNFWKYYAAGRGSWVARLVSGRIPPEKVVELGGKIEEEYIRLDGIVGDLVGASQDKAAVFIVSDHGMGIARGWVIFSLPILLEKLGWLFHQEDSREVDWTRTTVFDSTQVAGARYLSRDLMLNERAEGPLKRDPEQYQKMDLWRKVRDTLFGLRTVSGQKVFSKMKMSKEKTSGRDKLIVWPNLKLRSEDEVVIGRDRLPIDRFIDLNRLSGMHRMEGIFIARGPGIKPGFRVKDASILDITPTVLYFLGLAQAEDMEGRLLTSIIHPAYLAKNPIKYIPTHEGGRRMKTQVPGRSASDERILEMLRSLGYIN